MSNPLDPDRFTVKGGDKRPIFHYPDLLCVRALRFRPQHSPLSITQVSGLVGLAMEVRNRLGGNPLRMVELGAHSGESSAIWAGTRMFQQITLIDTWQNRAAKGLCEFRMRRFKNVNMVEADGIKAAERFEDDYFDFLYLDADHCKDFTVECLNAWMPKVKPGGIFAGHDWNEESWPGVIEGVTEVFNLTAPPMIFEDTSWLIQKPID